VTRTAAQSPAGSSTAGVSRRGLLLVAAAIVLTGLNLRTAVNSVGPVLEEIQSGLGLSSGMAGLVTTMPVICFAALGFAGPPLSARFRDAHVLAGGLLAMAAGLVLRATAGSFWLFLLGTVVAMTGGALGNVLLPSLVKRWFPTRTGLLVGAYSMALSLGGAVAAWLPQQIVAATGADGWRWASGRCSPRPPRCRGCSRRRDRAPHGPGMGRCACGCSRAARWPSRWPCSSGCRRSRPT
jgi:CP family cyanate transporter-like MFS transporter